MRTSTIIRSLAPLTFVALAAACTPQGGEDAGLTDASEEEHDGGHVVVDAGHDAGHTPPPDASSGGECPTIGPLSSPEGEPCDEEGKVCRESGCLAPGPGCLFIQCHNGVWVNQSLIDGGVPGTDGGDEGDAGDGVDGGDEVDGGDDTDGGDEVDAGDQVDAGDDDAGDRV